MIPTLPANVYWLPLDDSSVPFAIPPTQPVLCTLCVLNKTNDCQKCTSAEGYFIADDEDDFDESYL